MKSGEESMQEADDRNPKLQQPLSPDHRTEGPHFQHNAAVLGAPHTAEVGQAWKLLSASALEGWAPVIR